MYEEVIKEAALAVIEDRKTIVRLVQDLWRRLTRGTPRIVVFGDGGAGKTTLGQVLAGQDPSYAYDMSLGIERYELEGQPRARILVAPGQSPHVASWHDLCRTVVEGDALVVVNVVCWGLESFEESFREVQGYEPGATPAEFLARYAQLRREEELRTFRERLAPSLAMAPGRLSLLTLVSKQDLWWSQRHEVRAHYEQDYAAAVDEVADRIGRGRFSHCLRSAALVSQNLADGDGVVLRETTAGYDDRRRYHHMGRLISALEQIAGA